MKNPFLLPLFILFFNISAIAQVSQVKLGLNYDISSEVFTVNLNIIEGSANSPETRALFNSQISIAVPIDAEVQIKEMLAPFRSNFDYTSVIPTHYTISSSVRNNCLESPERFVSITPNLSPTNYFNDLHAGDVIPLFSFTCSKPYDGVSNIRLFDKANDPGPSAPCMGGGDFSNGITIGGFNNLYVGNLPTMFNNPYVNNSSMVCGDPLQINVEVVAAPFQKPLNFEWTGPNGFTSTTKDISVPNSNLDQAGLYQLKIKDATDIVNSLDFDSKITAIAGNDMSMCENEFVILKGEFPDNGSWRYIAGDIEETDIINQEGGTAILPMMKQGNYLFEYGGTACPDTLSLVIHEAPDATIWHTPQGISVTENMLGYSWYNCDNDQLIPGMNEASFNPSVSGSYYAVLENEFCSSTTDCVEILISSNTKVEDNKTTIYPNPASDIIVIKNTDSILEAYLTDMWGRSFMLEKLGNSNNYQIPSITSGLYLLKLNTQKGSNTHSLIVLQ